MENYKIKYYNYGIGFQEIPDEISLLINITNCNHECLNCHSSYLKNDIGVLLDNNTLYHLVREFNYISCVCFMGGDRFHDDIKEFAKHLKMKFPNLKVAMYSGNNELDNELVEVLDYYKVGSYCEELGGLNKKTTNQKLYRINNNVLEDITFMFWKH